MSRMFRGGLNFLLKNHQNSSFLTPKRLPRSQRNISYRKGRHSLKNGVDKLALPQFNTLDELRQIRRQQASASVLIQHSNDDIPFLYEKCVRYGKVKVMLSYKRDEKNLLLVEFENTESVSRLMKDSQHFRNNQHTPIETPFLFLPQHGGGKSQRKAGERALLKQNLLFRELTRKSDALDASLAKAESISAQMMDVYLNLRMSDINTRERFMISHLVEGVLRRVFSYCQVYPFGSSFSGFGRHDCDLDMICDHEEFLSQQRRGSNGLFFLSKLRPEDHRQDQQNNLVVVADMMKFIMPQVVQVKRILRAFVPIIRFTHLTNLQCDISMENKSAFYMTELLHLYGQIDERVRPLVFAIRHWAKEVDLTGHPGGLCISNFMLTLMAVFYMQQESCLMLPSVDQLKSLAGPKDLKVVNEEDCSFVSNWNKLATCQSKLTLEELLFGFLAFYEKFDFTNCGIDVTSGTTTDKPPETPCYMVNPIERHLNVCKNIDEAEIVNFQVKCRSSLKSLEENIQPRKNGSWGLLSFCQNKEEENTIISMNISSIMKDSIESSSGSMSDKVDNVDNVKVSDSQVKQSKIEGS